MAKRFRLHEFKGLVAIKIGERETQYISTKLAKELSRQLGIAWYQIEKGYHFPTTEKQDDT